MKTRSGRSNHFYNVDSAGTTIMDKLEILRKLDAIIIARLFGDRPWLPDSETAFALQKMLL
jgi:hypothetical protein